ncbi:MAG TPA: hypothetical protein VF163_00875 [Micromonosporaceae bacterium]
MTLRLSGAVSALRQASAELSDAGTRLADLDPGGPALAVDATGRLGELGLALHGELRQALAARARESVRHGIAIEALADAVASAAAAYAAVDESAQHRRPDGL